jgi:hypothetical protein
MTTAISPTYEQYVNVPLRFRDRCWVHFQIPCGAHGDDGSCDAVRVQKILAIRTVNTNQGCVNKTSGSNTLDTNQRALTTSNPKHETRDVFQGIPG